MNWREYQALQRVSELGERFLSYVDEGRGDPVLLLHGIPTWGYLWQGLLPALSGPHRVLVPDLLGFGYSDRRDCFDRSIGRQAELIDAWLGKLGLEHIHVVGHDIGGGVALRLATLFPRRVSRLALLNSVCYDSWPIEGMLQFGHPGAYRRLSATAALRLLKLMLRQGFARSPDDELLEGLLAPYATEVGKLSLIRNASALNTNLTTEVSPLLTRLELPALVLWGENDAFQPVKYGERLARDISGAQLVRVREARHFVMLDRPDEVGGHLLSFLGGAGAEPLPAGAGVP
ncbi:alpha/beta fold hydrolase [Tautonia sociabilis]|uniref:Alpha/beta hydrolase n=1 Tax=Tautonia sociabilis TaxID=2080755 RepID=A0A432ML72_9BACT|nr:alpha/beta hydrolase [Tautonia sociabilis]RUL87957.1 alpha/beta hydrolase [Tautonia sociabilis]